MLFIDLLLVRWVGRLGAGDGFGCCLNGRFSDWFYCTGCSCRVEFRVWLVCGGFAFLEFDMA